MASFSRGFGPRVLLLVRQQAPCECAAAQARLLLRARIHTSRLLQKAAQSSRPAVNAAPKPATPAAAPKPAQAKASSPAIGSATTAHAGRPSTYAEQLALKGRTLLYEAPSHFWFRAGCFCSAAFCVSYTVYQYWTVILHPPEGLMWWIPHAFSVILIFMAGMGAYFVLGAGRIVRSIEAVPAAAVAAKQIAAKAAGAAAAAAAPQSPIYIEVATRRAVPFMPAKKMLLRPEEVLLPMRMYTLYAGSNGAEAAQKSMSLAERVRAERAAREAKIAAKKYQMDHILTAPFRDAAKAFGTAWGGIKRSFSREGFAKIYLANREYKLDVTGGWALDEGRAMDRLLPVRPNTVRAR
ncbi:hypothetical protein C8A03DRAFT_15359 [Achaetomium macrosporum]|uniref:Uncharacterized protein n=1 Tax=Achaetomium macrosporum TaxID=79813 RepID=A0AAN7CBW7_9PEZI|nr:hypothetical protein C8A03DRAFT_15359 [Achaetomium macrosporum]